MTRRPSRRLAAVADRMDGGHALWAAPIRLPPPTDSRPQPSQRLSARTGRQGGHSRSDLGSDQPTSAVEDDVVQGNNNVTPLICTNSQSRAVERAIAPGSTVHCTHCGALVRFAVREKVRQVIANVYRDGRWARVEHFHTRCYRAAAEPYGPADISCLPSSSKAIGVGGPNG